MSDGPQTATDARALTRQRRERRTDAVIDLPFNEPHVEVTCPECRETFEVTIACGSPAEYSPTFSPCSTWECDAFLKYRHEASEDDAEAVQATGQQTLGGFEA